jgi:tetratricopeptide (TPR) repeat protein
MTYAVARVGEIEKLGNNLVPVRLHFGIQAFGANIWTGEQGEGLVPEHTEGEDDQELYVVLAGRATFTIAGQEIDAPVGTLVYLPGEEQRKAVAAEPETQVLAIGATRGKVYEASDWELWNPAREAYAAKDYERATELLEEQLAKHPGNATLVYNLACVESLAGRRDAALDHLEQAIELRDNFREFARGDDDFAPLRDDARFLALTGQTEAAGSGA